MHRTTCQLGLVLLCLIIAGCLDQPELTESSLEGDYVVPPEDIPVAERQQALTDTQVVFVEFDGVTVKDCPETTYCNDAIGNRSSIIESFFGQDSITWSAYENTAGQQIIMDELEEAFEPYDIVFTTERPASGPYTMLVIASNSEFSGLGVAPLDCDNKFPSSITFVYRGAEFAPETIANAAVHELGHSFGLSHVEHTHDYMYFQTNDASKEFTNAPYDIPNAPHRCAESDVQEAPEMLLEVLGPTPFDGHFVDDDGSVHEEAIDALYEEGITGGCASDLLPKFCPGDDVTRAQMAAFLSRALDLPPATQSYFEDTEGAWFEDYADRLAEAEITLGCDDGLYCGNDDVTRAQMALFLKRGFELPPATQSYFSDTAGTHYEDAANRLAEAGITMGCDDGKYCGSDTVTRGQMASFLARALGLI